LYLSEDLFAATIDLMYAEIGDKTFCLIIIFTISWANWNTPSEDDTIEVKGKKITTRVNNSVNPVRIYMAASGATCLVTVATAMY
jgi:hypothetical protein